MKKDIFFMKIDTFSISRTKKVYFFQKMDIFFQKMYTFPQLYSKTILKATQKIATILQKKLRFSKNVYFFDQDNQKIATFP